MLEESDTVMFKNCLTFGPIKYKFISCRHLQSTFLIQTQKISLTTINCYKSVFVFAQTKLTVGNNTIL